MPFPLPDFHLFRPLDRTYPHLLSYGAFPPGTGGRRRPLRSHRADKGHGLRYLYNRWVFFIMGVAGVANVLLLIYRFVLHGFSSHVIEHVLALAFSTLACTLAMMIFADLTMKKPKSRR